MSLQIIGATPGLIVIGDGEARHVLPVREVPDFVAALNEAYDKALALSDSTTNQQQEAA